MRFERIEFQDGLYYAKTHEWLKLERPERLGVIGLTDFAQAALGDIVFLELPEPGTEISAGEAFGSLESTKAVSDLNAPVSGRVLEINLSAIRNPSLVNESPFDKGWLVKIALDSSEPELELELESEIEQLMNHEQYKALCKSMTNARVL